MTTAGNLCRNSVNIAGDFVSQSGKTVSLRSRAKVPRLPARPARVGGAAAAAHPLGAPDRTHKRGPDGRKLRRLQVTPPRGLSVRGKAVALNKRVTAR